MTGTISRTARFHSAADSAAPSASNAWMRRYRDRLRLTDAIIVTGATLLAVWARSAFGAPFALDASPAERIGIPVLLAGLWVLCLSVFRTRAAHVIGVGAVEYRRVLNATATAFGMTAAVAIIAETTDARWYLAVAAPLGAACLLLCRWAWRRWLFAQRRSGRFLSRAIVVGFPNDVEYVAGQILHNAGAGFEVVGLAIDTTSAELEIGGTRLAVVSDLAGAADAAAALQADAVIVSGQYGAGSNAIRQLGWQLEGTATELVVSSRLTDVAGPRIHFRPVEGLPLLHVEIPTFDGWRHSMKRGFDVVFAATALLLLSPVLLVAAAAIKLDSAGPVLFRQTRCGRDGRTFEMLKFRSMVADAEQQLAALTVRDEGAGPLFKLHDDPRITRVGRFIRAHSIDELPQFWNVLVGDMSVVGPRPPLVSEVECYEEQVKRRLLIKPGLTGLWQISGRSDLGWEESVRLDLYYVENWSIMSDLMIIWRTVKTVLKSEGAY